MPNETSGLSNPMTVIALVNGMIGGIILVMPILALKCGYLMIAPVVLVCGFYSYYSCLLCIKHLRNYKDLDDAILMHFNNRRGFKIFYDIWIAFSLIILLILYFDLMCKQWQGIIYTKSKVIPIVNAIVLFPVVYIMKKYHFGASLLAYGIISTIGYCLFIIFMWINAPHGPIQFVTVDKHFPQLAAALGQGFTIQTFFIPILKKNPNRSMYKQLVKITYIIGGLVYAFIGYGGALSYISFYIGILNKPFPGTDKPQTITQYFNQRQWQVILLQIIYVTHLYSAYPQFLLISKKRLFSFLQWPEQTHVTCKQVIYVAIIILICLIIKLTNLSPQTLIQLNGSVVAFVFLVVIPVGLHIKCLYFTQKQQSLQKQTQKHNQQQINQYIQSSKDLQQQHHKTSIHQQIQLKQLQFKQLQNQDKITLNQSNHHDSQQQQQSKPPPQQELNKQNPSETQPKPKQILQQTLFPPTTKTNTNISQCNDDKCDIQFKSKTYKYCDLFVLVTMTLTGIATMIYTIYLIVLDHAEQNNQMGN